MSDDSERERHINMHMSPEIMAGAYANFANVSHSDYEFTITFARVDHEIEDEEVPGVVVSRAAARARTTSRTAARPPRRRSPHIGRRRRMPVDCA